MRPTNGLESVGELRVKICGVRRNEDALHAQRSGADYVGVVASSGFGRSVPVADIPRVLEGVTVRRVAVLVDEPPAEAIQRARAVGANVLQLHGSESSDTVRALRTEGSWTIWKAVRAQTVDDLRRAVDDFHELVDGFLIEGWRAGVIGGAGLTLELSGADVRQHLPTSLEFILAGGLTPETVAGAVARFRPHVVDVSSGIERVVGVKDPALIDAFIAAAHSATVQGRTPPTSEQ